MTRSLFDTSILIGAEQPDASEGAISVASIAELHFGVILAADPDERARRAGRLGVVEATFSPLRVTAEVAREWGRLMGAVRQRGAQPRRRSVDLLIAATANVHRAVLITHNRRDFAVIEDLVEVRSP